MEIIVRLILEVAVVDCVCERRIFHGAYKTEIMTSHDKASLS